MGSSRLIYPHGSGVVASSPLAAPDLGSAPSHQVPLPGVPGATVTAYLRPAGPTPAPVSPAQPPFLVTTGTDRRALSVGVVADASGAVIEMTVHGRWSQQLAGKAAATLQLCLAGPTASI